LLRGFQLPLHRQRNGDPLSRQGGRVADPAGGDLRVLLGDGGRQVVHGQAVGQQLVRIDPDAHRLFGAKELNAADALDPAQLLDHVTRQVVAQRHLVETPAIGGQADQQQKAR